MGGTAIPNTGPREPARSIVARLLPPSPAPRLLLILALLSVARAQWTTQLRRSCPADLDSANRWAGSEFEERMHAQLARVVSALRQSEARAAQLVVDLSAVAERYRDNITAQSQLAAGAARNSCDERAAECRASAAAAQAHALDAANRLLVNVSDGFRREAIERAVLISRADGVDAQLRTHDATLRSVERNLNETRSELSATMINITADEKQQIAEMSNLQLNTMSRLALIENRLNRSESSQNESAQFLSLRCDSLNDSLTTLETALRHDMQTGSVIANSKLLYVKSELASNISSLADALRSAINNTNEQISACATHSSELRTLAVQQMSAVSDINTTLQEGDVRWRQQFAAFRTELNTNEQKRVADMNTLRLATLPRLAVIEERLNASENQLNKSVDSLSRRHDLLNDSLTSLDTAVHQGIQMLSETVESKLLAAKSEIANNVSTLVNAVEFALNSTNELINVTTDQIAELFTISDRQELTIRQLNHTQQHSEANWNSKTSSLSAQLNAIWNKMANNVSSLTETFAFALNYLNKHINASTSNVSDLFTIADLQKFAIRELNRTQQECDFSWKQRARALSAELNSTKLEIERLRQEHLRLRRDHEQLVSDTQNTTAAQPRACSSGWRRNGSYCYILVTSWGGTWNDTRGRCNMVEADFVTVPNAAVNAFLSTYMSSMGVTSAWLGATDVEIEGVWRWITGEIFYSSTLRGYTNFAVGEPNNNYLGRRTPENCLSMNRFGSWQDAFCSLYQPFFCQIHRP